MKRSPWLVVLLALVVTLLVAPGAMAHPLGNFSINHLSTIRISADRVDVRYVLDQAEIPTVRERGLSRQEVLRRKAGEVARRLDLVVNGRPVRLAPSGSPRLSFPPGAGGLKTTRLELSLAAAVRDPRTVQLRDGTFPGRVGWKAVVAEAGRGTAVRTDAPSGDPTRGLRTYPEDLSSRPADRRRASFAVRPGSGELTAPASEGGPTRTVRAAPGGQGGEDASTGARSADGFAALFEDAASGEAVLVLLLLAAAGWGALHALSPGHGKAMVAAYLVGTRGGARHAVALGATVTVTHTIGVFALGVVTLGLSQYVLPEDLYPWLTLISGLLVVAVGAGVLRSRARHARHHHHHHHHEKPSWRGVLGLGAAAGLIPCPSALVVLLAAISQHQVALGLGLITAFSLGLAATLTALGLIVVYARDRLPRLRRGGRIAAALPSLSALVIVGVGCVLTAKALPGVM
jgi:nickel/cobalt transporter (NicO) family protein